VLTEDGVDGVHGDLVLGGISDETLRVGEGDVGRGGAIPLIVGDDLNAVVLPHADARVRRAEIDADRRPLAFACHLPLALLDALLDRGGKRRRRRV
jgi:hypothetical protein